jgi:hypothetical protein
MAFGFRKSFGFGKFCRFNVTHRGLSVSAGAPGARVSIPLTGNREPTLVTSIPDTGLYHRETLGSSPAPAVSESLGISPMTWSQKRKMRYALDQVLRRTGCKSYAAMPILEKARTTLDYLIAIGDQYTRDALAGHNSPEIKLDEGRRLMLLDRLAKDILISEGTTLKKQRLTHAWFLREICKFLAARWSCQTSSRGSRRTSRKTKPISSRRNRLRRSKHDRNGEGF